jgi:hypothetical protein
MYESANMANLERVESYGTMERWKDGKMKLNEHSHNLSDKGIKPAAVTLFTWFLQP